MVIVLENLLDRMDDSVDNEKSFQNFGSVKNFIGESTKRHLNSVGSTIKKEYQDKKLCESVVQYVLYKKIKL